MLIPNRLKSARKLVRICFFLVPVLFTVGAVLSIAGQAQTPATIAEQLTTAERITRSKWWPTKGNAPRTDYAGSGACAECHFAMVKSQPRHSMTTASVPATASDILRDHAGESLRLDAYEYKIVRQAGGAFEYSVTD